MQNWKNFVTLTTNVAASGTGPTTAAGVQATTKGLGRQLNRLSCRYLTSGSSQDKPPRLANVSSTRSQSTSRTNLAANQAPRLRKEVLDSSDEIEGENQADLFQAGKQLLTDEELAGGIGKLNGLSDINREPDAHRFVKRHIGPREEDIRYMLNELSYSSMDELIRETIPDDIKLNRDLNLPEAISEHELLNQLKEIGSLNESTEWKSFIGLGYYDCVTPPVILRNLFENPGWTTAYTAYQAEIAQGRLESLMNYQTMISDLTGLDVANASLLDEATAAAEAMQVCLRYHKSKRNKFLISTRCHPQTGAVLKTRAEALDVEIDYFDELGVDSNVKSLEDYNLKEYSGLLVQYPNTQGHLFDLNAITKRATEADCLAVTATDLMACTLFKPPGDFEYPADLAIGSAQRFGIPLNFGGPHAAFMACKQKLIRLIPGRVVGLTRDSDGNQAYRFALQTREQHIRRDKATSNICTAQALLANMSAMYAVYHGPKGLRDIANSIHAKTSLLAHLLKSVSAKEMLGANHKLELVNDGSFFDTLTVKVGSELQSLIHQRAREAKINLRYDDEETICVSLDETTKLADIFKLVYLFTGHSNDQLKLGKQKQIISNTLNEESKFKSPLDSERLANLKRTSEYLTHPTFNIYHSEAQLIRYMKSLENKDISLAHSMIPLGSCTMKLNATSQILASSWPEFANVHPFQPIDQCKGYMELIESLNTYLCEITGYDRISFQPNSGAQGEYAGLRVIKSYLESRGETNRNVCLIPISAHGTNPASAQMAGFKIQTVKVKEDGNIDMEDLGRSIEKYRNDLACLMVTYPSTFGVFEDNIRQVCDMIHEAGGQVYLDGANMNAQVGLCRPGDYGSDVSHLNLHKTFCIPHGGGGPGAGPIGVKSHLIPFLPGHPLTGSSDGKAASPESFGTVSASMWGSPVILPISWSYIRTMSKDLKLSSQVAILNANYMRKRLEGAYKILYKGTKGNVAHEFIIDCRPFKKTAGIEAVDIAKRLQDFGFHAPTVSWPVTNTLMVEPTESEDRGQLDKYCDALLAIRKEIEEIENGKIDKDNNPIRNAPHTQQVVCSSNWTRPYTREQAAFPASFVNPLTKIWPTVGRVDDTYGDTNLFCSCPPVQTTQ